MPHQQVRHPRVTQPSATDPRRSPCDLHVLGTPPAFTLSQDQTLHHDFDVMMLRLIPSGPSSSLESLQGISKCTLLLAPTEVVCSHLFAFLTLIWHAIHRATPREVSLLHSSLVQVRGALQLEGHKKPRRPGGTSGRRYGTSYVPVRRCLGSSMLPLSRLVDGLTVVNASLAQ